jgi:hypothetical protein
MARHVYQDSTLKKEEDTTDDAGGHHLHPSIDDLCRSYARAKIIDSVPNQHREQELCYDRSKNAKNTDCQLGLIRAEIAGEFLQVIHRRRRYDPGTLV